MGVGFPTAPPHSLDAERSVIGGLLLNDSHMSGVQLDARLLPADFYREQLGQAYEAMLALYEAGKPIDPLTVEQQMVEAGHGSVELRLMLDEATGWVPAAGHVVEYARIVRKHALRRRLLLATYETQAGVVEDRPLQTLLEDAERSLLAIADEHASELGVLTPDDEFERLSSIRAGVDVVGTASGFVDLDRITSGFQAGNLIVLAARPSMGKSALVVNIAENVASKGGAVALFSLEMSRGEILRRLLASQARVPGESLLRGPIRPDHWERLIGALGSITSWPLYVDEGMDAGVIDVRAKARRLHKRKPLDLVIVDYVQLMRASAGAENRNIEVGLITRGLKLLAKELGVPVIAVSQLSRAVEHRQDKHPQLSDLRDSGSVEQDADLVVFMYRDSYYNEDAEEQDMTELKIAKHRNGPLGDVKLTFLAKYPKFASYAGGQDGLVSYGSSTGMPF